MYELTSAGLRRMLSSLLCLATLAIPQAAAAPERDVRFSNGAVELAGTLVRPATGGPHPAILLLQGSGDHAREPGLHLARWFAELGLVGLAYDKRGTGASSGDWRESTLDDLARDAEAGLAFLRAQPEVDPARVGVFAPSQGAWVACALAEHGAALAFLIAFSGGGVTPLEAERWAYARMLEHLEPEQEQLAQSLVERYLACLAGDVDSADFLRELEAARQEPFFAAMQLERNAVMAARRDSWAWVARFDPRPGAQRIRGPVLVLLGEKDELQPCALAARRWREALARGGNRDVSVHVFPDANHYLRAEVADPSADPHAAPFVPGFEATLEDWLRSRVLAGPRPEVELVVRDVTVVDTEAGELRPHQTVLVRGARIARVSAADGAAPAPGARVIEGAGRFLMPGLVDAHVHVTERDLPLFLANGVTTIRELNGSPTHLDLRARIATGELLGPRMQVSSPLLAGEAQRWRHVLLREPVAAAEKALALADEGYDALKVYDGLGREVYAALEEIARERSLPLVGHIPREVGLEGVLAAHQGIEHSNQILQAVGGHALDAASLPALVASIRRAGVTVTPTLASQLILDSVDGPEFGARFARPELAYVERDTLAWWQSLRRSDADSEDGPSAWFTRQAELVLALARAGVPLLVGTDTPNPLLVPGFSIHDELEALVAAGLTRAEVLRAATVRAASLLALENQGRIAPGQSADLVLLESDPFAALESLRHPLGVCAAGRWLDRDELAASIAPLVRED